MHEQGGAKIFGLGFFQMYLVICDGGTGHFHVPAHAVLYVGWAFILQNQHGDQPPILYPVLYICMTDQMGEKRGFFLHQIKPMNNDGVFRNLKGETM
jgi:hypothetical protein